MPKLSEILFGKKAKTKQVPTLSADQQQLFALLNQGLSGQGGAFGDLFNFDEGAFQKGVGEPVMKNFLDRILPQLQEKFIGSGGTGNVLGSGFQREQARAGENLQSQLAQLMYQAQQGAQQNKLSGAQTALGIRPFENLQRGPSEGLVQGAVRGLVGGATRGFGGVASDSSADFMKNFFGGNAVTNNAVAG